MNKITKLTKKQEEDLIEFRQKMFEVGCCTDPADRQRAEAAISKMYKIIGEEKPLFVWGGSPVGCNLLIWLCGQRVDNLWDSLRDSLGDNLWANLWASLGDSLGDNLWANLWASLGDNLRANLGDNLRDNLWDSLGDNLRDNLRDSLGDNLRDNLWDSLRDSLGDNLWANLWASLGDTKIQPAYTDLWGSMDLYWIAFYRFCEKIGVKYNTEDSHRLSLWNEIAHACGWWYPYKNICFICDRPTQINWTDDEIRDKRLHGDEKPAIEFRDGWKIWSLNGVLVPEEIALTPANQLDPAMITTIDNADVRREFVNKVGIERICHKLNAETVDSVTFENQSGIYKYDLIVLNLPHAKWKYLKFQSASLLDFWHVEGIPNRIRSVRRAIMFRNGLTEKQIDEKNGADYYQHGDVLLKPRGAKKFKLYPAWIA